MPSRLLAAVAAAAFALVLAAPASAAAPWNCRASAVWTSVAGNDRVEPVLANGSPNTSGGASGDLERCASADVGADNLAEPLGVPATFLSARTASAQTSITPASGPPISQRVESHARIEDLALPLGSGTVVLGARAIHSRAVAACGGGQPVMEGASEVVGLTLGGENVTIDEALEQLEQLLAPLGPLVDVRFNEQIREGGTLTVRPVWVRVLSAAGTPLLEAVAGETRIVAGADTCDPDAPGNLPPGGTNNNNSGNAGNSASSNVRPCPRGAQLDAESGFCVIPATATESVIVVGRPFEGPSGGTVVRLTEARKLYSSSCLEGPGPRYAVIGTRGNDRITGTNGPDRILGLAGNDQLSGGRGNDCLDGMTGRDNLSGSIGTDRLYGMAGRDALNGGPGTDRLSGGSGNDSINAAYGADRVFGGSGNDAINVSTQGPVARVSCGTGRDRVRFNRKERRSLRSCEVRYMLDDR